MADTPTSKKTFKKVPLEELEGLPADDSTENAAFILAEADRARQELAEFSELHRSLIEDVVMNDQTLVSWAKEHEMSEGMATNMKQKTLRALRYRLRGKEGE